MVILCISHGFHFTLDARILMNLSPQLAKTVDEYIQRVGDWRGEIIRELREIVQSTVPKAEESIRWGMPVYELNGPICYIKSFRNQVHLGFWRGNQLKDPKGLLCQSMEKMRHIHLTDLSQIQKSPIRELLKSAAKLNKELGDPTKVR